ncbi:hypothetical protein, partial [Gordonia desulfuricans]|uniref:hypothetical protein n=1 Tax=Gordonia desulfuricans TaxID=89051 RepID=UPI001EE3D957
MGTTPAAVLVVGPINVRTTPDGALVVGLISVRTAFVSVLLVGSPINGSTIIRWLSRDRAQRGPVSKPGDRTMSETPSNAG